MVVARKRRRSAAARRDVMNKLEAVVTPDVNVDRGVAGRAAIAEKIRKLFPQGCTRVLFVNPPHVPEEDFDINVAVDNRYPVYPPYGLGILAAELGRRGYVTNIVDLNYLLQENLKRKPAEFGYRIWEDILRRKLDEFKPDLVGMGCMFTITHRQMKRIADFVKGYRATMPVVAGGVHTSTAADLVLKDCKSIDVIVLYEGNSSFGDMLDFVNGKAPERELTQLAALIDGQYTTMTARAEKTPQAVNIAPKYHDLPIDKYSALGRIGVYYWLFPPGTRASTVLSNIGCRAQCTFCSVRHFNGKGVVTRDVTGVVDELEALRDRYGISHIMWLDDDLFYTEKRAVQLFNEMSKRRLGITWDASNGVIASAMTEEIVQSAAESGCIALSIGIESGSPEILRSVRKPSGVKHFYVCAEILRKYPTIFTRGLLMCGFPGETVGQQLETVKLGVEIRLDWYTIQPLNFIPGVEITNHALVAGIIEKRSLFDGSERPFIGSTGGQIRREESEKKEAKAFVDLFQGDPRRVTGRDEIKDVWFLMDYRVNYEKLWEVNDTIKLEMLRKMFVNMCDRTHKENALGNLYFALIDYKLGYLEDARRRIALARQFAETSQYWRVRFEIMNLHRLLDRLERDIARADAGRP